MCPHPRSVLAVTSELPWPLDSGGHLRTFHLLAAAARFYQVTLVTAAAGPVSTHQLEAAGIRVRLAQIGRARPLQEARKALLAAIAGEPYVMYRRHGRVGVRRALEREVRRSRPDILYLDHLDSFMYSPTAPGVLTVCDLHNVYSLLTARAAIEQEYSFRRAYLKREGRLLAKTEARVAAHGDLLFSVSEQEADYFRRLGGRRVCVVPNGVECDRYADLPTERSAGPPVIMYIGTMSWPPNSAAARYLALQVLPALQQRLPDARVRIVGRDPPPEVADLRRHPGVEVTGRVDDILPHLRDAHVLAVPLESGGGTRLKILEAFAAGLPVISTPVGCEGIAAEPDRHLCVAPRERFAEALISLLLSPQRRREMAEAARRLARNVYDWRIVGQTAVDAIESACEERLRQRRSSGGSKRPLRSDVNG